MQLRAIKKSKRILINNSEPLGNLNINKCRFHYSQQLVEKPVNVLINRNVLISISEYSEIIKKSHPYETPGIDIIPLMDESYFN